VRRRHRGSTTECVAAGVLTSSAAAFHLTVSLEVRVEDHLHFQRHWTASFPRLLL